MEDADAFTEIVKFMKERWKMISLMDLEPLSIMVVPYTKVIGIMINSMVKVKGLGLMVIISKVTTNWTIKMVLVNGSVMMVQFTKVNSKIASFTAEVFLPSLIRVYTMVNGNTVINMEKLYSLGKMVIFMRGILFRSISWLRIIHMVKWEQIWG